MARKGKKRRSYRRSRRGVGGHRSHRSMFGGMLSAIKRNAPPALIVAGLAYPMVRNPGGSSAVDSLTQSGASISDRLTNTLYNAGSSLKAQWEIPVTAAVGAIVLRKALKYVR